jgi:hypothetical protein
MILALLRVDVVNKPSLISESVAETRVNIHPVGEKPDNMPYVCSLGPYV